MTTASEPATVLRRSSGWLFIIAGLIRLILPTLAETLAPAVYSGPAALMVAGVVVLIVGGILSFEGYRA